MTALLKALPLGIAVTLIASLILSPYGPYSVYLRVEPVAWSFFDFYWSWPIFAVMSSVAWGFFWLFEIR